MVIISALNRRSIVQFPTLALLLSDVQIWVETLETKFNYDEWSSIIAYSAWRALLTAFSRVCGARHIAYRHIDWSILRQLQPLESEITAFSNFARRNDVGTYQVLDICRN